MLQQLPPPRRGYDLLRAAILLGMTFLASALAYVVSGGGRFVTMSIERLASLPVLWVFVLALASGLVISAVGATAALSSGRALET